MNEVIPTKALYNGNISAMKWESGNDTIERGYKFTYDSLNRLTGAIYGEGPNLASNLNRFNEVVTYNDKMGNIKTLVRRGKLNSGYGDMDNLTYTYSGNRLTKVSDAVTTSITYEGAFHFVDRANADNEYTYDKNGNLTKDLNKNITSITYNALNLPGVITYSNGNTITYVYDGAGNKLSVAYYNNSDGTMAKMEYAGNKVYRNGTLSMLLTEEGYATFSGTTPTYHYYLKDHQGNNRVVVNQGGEVEQVNHYYPFGGLFGEGTQPSIQRYKYNGKELDREMELDMYDFHWRQYMADLGLTTTLDPHAENYYNLSPYSMSANNPINFIDPDGRDVWEVNNRGKVVNRIETTEHDAFYMVDKKGNRIEGKELMFEYGTIENFKSQYSDEAKTTFDWYNVRGDESGKQLFEFFANNTSVEWSQLQLGQKGDNGLNIVSTSHEKSTERSVNFLLDNQYQFGYTIRGHNHNHPSNTPYPSGLDTRGSDIGFSNKLTNISLKNGSGVPSFNIYLPKTGKYIRYNRNSTYNNFPNALSTIALPEIQIVAPRKK